MKQLLSWIILLLFLVNLGGFFYVIKFQEYSIRKEIKAKIEQGISKEKLIVFNINQSNEHEFEWEHNHEFEFNHIKYDVVSKITNPDGSMTVECISDIEETQLEIKLDSYISQRIKGNNNGKHPIVEFHTFLSHLFIESNSSSCNLIITEENLIIKDYTNLYNYIIINHLLDPPKG